MNKSARNSRAIASIFECVAAKIHHLQQKFLLRNRSTELVSLERQWNVQVNNQPPIIITSQGVDPVTGQMRTFKSKEIWAEMDAPKKSLIPVYVDPRDPKRYFMDLTHIEERLLE